MTKTAKTAKTTAPRLPKGWTFKPNNDLETLNMEEGKRYSIVFKNAGYHEKDDQGNIIKSEPFKGFDIKGGKRGFDINAVTVDGKDVFFQLALFGDDTQEAIESGYIRNYTTKQWEIFRLPAIGERFTFSGKFEIRTIDQVRNKIRTTGAQLVAFSPEAIQPVKLDDFPERPDLLQAKKELNKANAEKNRKQVEKALDKYATRDGADPEPPETQAL